VGVERLLLGTDWPFKSPGAARSYVDYCELSEDDKAAVAGGNLARLLRLDALPADYPETDQGRILETAKRGAPVDHVPVIDPHTHILHDGLMGSGYIPIPFGDAEHMIRRNRRLGVDAFACSTWVGIWIDYRDGIALTRELQLRHPDDIIPYAALDPRKSDDVEADVRLMMDEYGWRGLKPYNPRMGLPYNDPLFDPWYARGNELGAFVKLHQTAIGDRFYEEVEDVAVRYPNLSLMLAHSGWTWQVARERAAFAKRFPQVYLDLTFTSVLNGVVEFFCEEGLEDRVLFTTDAPMRDPIQQFGWVVYAEVSEEQKEKILGRNALRMLAHAGLPLAEAIRRRYGLPDDAAPRGPSVAEAAVSEATSA
jgi:predicted TIM-barrel fold metal-dependent hydrolase